MSDTVQMGRKDAQAILDALEKIYAKSITMNNGTHREWIQKRIALMRSVVEQEGSGDELEN